MNPYIIWSTLNEDNMPALQMFAYGELLPSISIYLC